MLLDADQCYRALRTHDTRFDGRFFVGVGTTRIYCRPVCTARTPLRANCRFFPSAAAAEAQGFRPCLRCRPELAPGYSAVDANRRLAQSAAGLIEDGRLAEATLADLAIELDVTDRHLRRVFQHEFGVSPVEYAQTQRLLLAKRLLTDTTLPVIDIALASGFASLRRFNALFRTRYRMTPTDLRRSAPSHEAERFTFELAFRPPYAWDAMLAFLARRAIDGVEAVDARAYHRTMRVELKGRTHSGSVSVSVSPRRPALRVAADASLAAALPGVLARVKQLFDLACRPDEIDAALGVLSKAHPGLRLPGAVDGFEVAVRAVLGQQITVAAARTLARRFVDAFGEPIETRDARLRRLFPSAQAVAQLDPRDVAACGVIGTRAEAIVELARAVSRGSLRLDPSADVPHTIAALERLPGVGPWTAQYIAMRALAWPDAFPHPDVAVLKALGKKGRAALQAAEAWRPWRAYAVLHLWKSLEASR